MEKKSNSNTLIVVLLSVLIVAVLAVGGYFIIKDIRNKDDDSDNHSSQVEPAEKKESEKQDDDQKIAPAEESDDAVSNEIEAGITYAEVRGNDFYVEVQVNGQVTGRCDISVMPTNGTQGHQDDDDLEIRNKVSICDEDFSLKGMNPGEHKVTVVIRADDGRTKTLEKIVNI